MRDAVNASLVGCLFLLSGCAGTSDPEGTGGGAGMSTGATGGGGTGGTGGSGGSGTTGGSAGSMTGCSAGPIIATPGNNYQFHSELTIDVTKVKPSTELFFDWSAVSKDFLGHNVDLATIGMVEIALWNMSLDEFEQKLNDDTLLGTDLAIIATILPDGTHKGSILDLTESGQPVEDSKIMEYLDIAAYPPENHVYTMMVADGMALGKGTRMLHGFQLDAASTNTMVAATSTSTHLAMTANLHALIPPTIPVGNPAITIDWDDMATTAAGLPFDPQQITQLRVGKYSLTPAEMETQENFLSLDMKADTLYRAAVTAGTKIELSKAKDPAGNAFPGIDATSNWIIALNCGECANPAPWYLTVVKPCP